MDEEQLVARLSIIDDMSDTLSHISDVGTNMLSTFESASSAASAAGAIGEINTRMALTGDALTDVTGKFLDFSSITGSDVVGSMQNVTKVMNKWNVEQSEVVSVLDKLAYAGQISGASVDSLSSQLINGASSFQAMGLSLDTTISLLSSFELQGINSGTAIMGLKTAVKNFSDDGLNAADALRDTVEQISNMGSEAEATSLAIDVFGSRAGVEFANAIRNGAITVEMLSGDLSVAEGTLQRTANASETLGEKWDKANNKITTAITNSLQPTIDSISGKLSELFGSVGDFLGEHPAAVKVIGAFAAGLGAVTVIFAGYTTAVNLAIPAVEAFSKALSANPIGKWVTIATTAITIITALAVAFSDSSDSVEDYDGTLEECSREIENTRLGKQHSTVFPTRETEKIIGALSEYTSTPQLPVVSEVSKQYESIINYGDTTSHVNNAYDSSVKTDVSGMLQSLTDSIESVFIPIMGKTVSAIGEIASSNNNNVTENKIVLPERSEAQSSSASASDSNTSEKHIVIDINGNGKIEVSDNADTESILEVLQENLKPVLLGIIEQEVYEGGDNDYEY